MIIPRNINGYTCTGSNCNNPSFLLIRSDYQKSPIPLAHYLSLLAPKPLFNEDNTFDAM